MVRLVVRVGSVLNVRQQRFAEEVAKGCLPAVAYCVAQDRPICDAALRSVR